MPDPPVIEQTEVETTEAATNNDVEANDTGSVMETLENSENNKSH